MKIRLLAVIFLTIGVGRPARASVVLPLGLDDLVTQADQIVLGRVVEARPVWTSASGHIVTDVVIEIERSYKGGVAAGKRVIVRREGGEVGEVGMLVPGAAQFRVGEQVFVFTEHRGAHSYVVGMAQGKLRVVMQNGLRLAVPSTGDLGFLRAPPPGMLQAPVELEALEREVQSRVVRGQTREHR